MIVSLASLGTTHLHYKELISTLVVYAMEFYRYFYILEPRLHFCFVIVVKSIINTLGIIHKYENKWIVVDIASDQQILQENSTFLLSLCYVNNYFTPRESY